MSSVPAPTLTRSRKLSVGAARREYLHALGSLRNRILRVDVTLSCSSLVVVVVHASVSRHGCRDAAGVTVFVSEQAFWVQGHGDGARFLLDGRRFEVHGVLAALGRTLRVVGLLSLDVVHCVEVGVGQLVLGVLVAGYLLGHLLVNHILDHDVELA